ncbi:DUF397 domain-containing protein [Nocardiopsis mwathae]|uniref:DUF397 domain-containing protein n=1 Tax=Nocardiopsis mwathae TaxID=1472723 RepID=UPI0016231201
MSPVSRVEVAVLLGGTAVHDSKHPEKGRLSLSRPEWAALLGRVKPHSRWRTG